MEPFGAMATAIAPSGGVGSRHLEAGVSADETKYDGRHLRDRFVALQRIVIVIMIGVVLVILAGDGFLFRRWKQTQTRAVRVGNFRQYEQDRQGADALTFQEQVEREREKRANAEPHHRWDADGNDAKGDPQAPEDEQPRGFNEQDPRVFVEDAPHFEDPDGAANQDGIEQPPDQQQLEEAAAVGMNPVPPDGGTDGGAFAGARAGAGGSDENAAPAAEDVAEGDAAGNVAGDNAVDGVGSADGGAVGEPQGGAGDGGGDPDAPRGEELESVGDVGSDGASDMKNVQQPARAVRAVVPRPDDADAQELDWSLPLRGGSCDAYFGNGYSSVSRLVAQDGRIGGDDNDGELLKCAHHPDTGATYCLSRDLVVHPTRVRMSRGGESLESVMGRSEDEELPAFDAGAFEIAAGASAVAEGSLAAGMGPALSSVANDDGPKSGMLGSLRVVARDVGSVCTRVVREPVLLLTRVEYANLFHTSTDWYNAWQAARVAGLHPTSVYDDDALLGLTPESVAAQRAAPRERTRRLPVHVVFVDGHNAGPMDDGWQALFLSMNYLKHFDDGTCFAQAIWAPYGYKAAISSGIGHRQTSCPYSPFVRQFSDDFVRALGIAPRTESTCMTAPTSVLFVRRVHYLAHPRHNGQIVRRLENEDDIMTALTSETRGANSDMRLVDGLFSSMSIKEQVTAAQDACVIVGAHGAGLSHVLFAPPGVHVLELQTPGFQRPHFIAYTSWAGSHHHLKVLMTSTPAPRDVVGYIRDAAKEASVGERVGGA